MAISRRIPLVSYTQLVQEIYKKLPPSDARIAHSVLDTLDLDVYIIEDVHSEVWFDEALCGEEYIHHADKILMKDSVDFLLENKLAKITDEKDNETNMSRRRLTLHVLRDVVNNE